MNPLDVYSNVMRALHDATIGIMNVVFSQLAALVTTLVSALFSHFPTLALPNIILNIDLTWLWALIPQINAIFPISAIAAAITLYLTLTNADWLIGLATAAWRFTMRNGW